MNKEQKEKIAINAANVWCRCFKCDGKVNATGCVCEKDKKLTCHKWYDGYRTAMLALSEYEQQMMKDAVDACVTDIRTYKEENEVDFTVMYEKGIIPYEIEQEVKVIVIKED